MPPAGADVGEEVTVTVAGQSKQAVADESGRWQVELDALKASAEGQVLAVAGKNTIELEDVLIGEVWICSGQSNMERQLGLRPGQKPIINFWEEAQKARKEKEREVLVEGAEDGEGGGGGTATRNGGAEGLPFACLICKEPWDACADPVVTKCGHYFCERCALKQNAKTGKCFACGKGTGGIFNTAHEIIKSLKPK